MDYEEMSDFEINREVSISLGHAYDGRGYIDGADGIYHVAIQWGRRVELPDYCNNPSDAWPIIIENKIDIQHHDGFNIPCAKHCEHMCADKNPLRAAMIVFLMMRETV